MCLDVDVGQTVLTASHIDSPSSRFHGNLMVCACWCYRLLWWYWQALKRNHHVLAPFLAPYHALKGHTYYSAMLLAKYAAVLASGSILYHIHVCFSLQRTVIAAFSPTNTSTAQLNLVSQEWWTGRLILLALSMGLQKIPLGVIAAIFRLDEVREGKKWGLVRVCM